ncbi:uncharacterized protein [Arachis hypogaea]|uniref:uncharacterized protein n=1 Tax=Arachis hypogaea TaxID=3818 RepID=UPI000DEC0A5B|nr:zinc finger MYM-type protein 1-like [Arachis hypogaea]
MPTSGSASAFLRRLVSSSSSSSGAGLRGAICSVAGSVILPLGLGSWSWELLVLLLGAAGSAAGSWLLGAAGSAAGFCLVEFRVLQFTLVACPLDTVILQFSYVILSIFLLRQELAFRGNDETDDSVNQGNFLELLNFLAQHNKEIDRAFKNSRGNLKLRAPSIQKDIVRAVASETTKVIVNDLGDELFVVLIDEARDISIKEQMSLCLKYVNKEGQVREHFLGLVHVSNINALSLKLALESLLEIYNLSLSRIRGQGYDGSSNMQGEINGLKTLILKENSYAFYVHCFAHQLQLALVMVGKKQVEIVLLFNLLTNLCNVVGVLCKRRDMLRDSQMIKTIEVLQSGEISSGRGLNQEMTLKRAGDTRWGSHYGTILRLISLFSSMVNVLEYVEEDGNNSEQRAEACHLLNIIQSFEFIFNLHLMKNILGITNELSQALQRNDQDIVNAMSLVKVSKQRLQNIRDDG